jgi:hypothetical protein
MILIPGFWKFWKRMLCLSGITKIRIPDPEGADALWAGFSIKQKILDTQILESAG